MIVRTYTNMWNMEKKLYTIYDITLPVPISFKQMGLFAFGSAIWMPIMYVLQVPFTNGMGFAAWLIVPLLIAIFGSQKLLQDKSLLDYAQSIIGFAFEPKRILDGDGISEAAEKIDGDDGKDRGEFRLMYTAWTKNPLGRN